MDEHRARLARAQQLLGESGLDAIVFGPGSSLVYFTGAEWGLSERFLGMVLSRSGEPAWVTPAFEKDRALEQIRVGSDVRAWNEDESPYALVAGILKDRGVSAGHVGIEETMPFAFSDGIGQALPAAMATCRTVDLYFQRPPSGGQIEKSYDRVQSGTAGQTSLPGDRSWPGPGGHERLLRRRRTRKRSVRAPGRFGET